MSYPDAYRILVVDDNVQILQIIAHELENVGFEVVTASSGEEALTLIRRVGLPHLALVDINMPLGMDGFEFCEAVRQFSDLPIIMLTGVDHSETIVKAIENFAEDYITKPFNAAELIARVKRVLSRMPDFSYALDSVTRIDDSLSIDFPNRQLIINGKTRSLTPTETELLYILVRAGGRTVTADFLMRRLWPMERVKIERVRVNIHRLRHKIESASPAHQYIVLKRGSGYAFVKPD